MGWDGMGWRCYCMYICMHASNAHRIRDSVTKRIIWTKERKMSQVEMAVPPHLWKEARYDGHEGKD